MMDVIKQVAEAKCLGGCYDGDTSDCRTTSDYDATCPVCQGTGLRWPTLSRECQVLHVYPKGEQPSCCGGSGRVPEVTLEKIHNILWVRVNEIKYRPYECHLSFSLHDPVIGRGESDLEAACHALLTAASEPSPATPE